MFSYTHSNSQRIKREKRNHFQSTLSHSVFSLSRRALKIGDESWGYDISKNGHSPQLLDSRMNLKRYTWLYFTVKLFICSLKALLKTEMNIQKGKKEIKIFHSAIFSAHYGFSGISSDFSAERIFCSKVTDQHISNFSQCDNWFCHTNYLWRMKYIRKFQNVRMIVMKYILLNIKCICDKWYKINFDILVFLGNIFWWRFWIFSENQMNS